MRKEKKERGRTGREKNLDKAKLSKQSPHQKESCFISLSFPASLPKGISPPQLSLTLLQSCLLSLQNNNKGSTWLEKVPKCVKIRKKSQMHYLETGLNMPSLKNLEGKWFFHGKELEWFSVSVSAFFILLKRSFHLIKLS